MPRSLKAKSPIAQKKRELDEQERCLQNQIAALQQAIQDAPSRAEAIALRRKEEWSERRQEEESVSSLTLLSVEPLRPKSELTQSRVSKGEKKPTQLFVNAIGASADATFAAMGMRKRPRRNKKRPLLKAERRAAKLKTLALFVCLIVILVWLITAFY